MVKLKEFSLLEGEEVLQQIEGDAYNDSPNPIMRLIAAVVRIIWLILGVRSGRILLLQYIYIRDFLSAL